MHETVKMSLNFITNHKSSAKKCLWKAFKDLSKITQNDPVSYSDFDRVYLSYEDTHDGICGISSIFWSLVSCPCHTAACQSMLSYANYLTSPGVKALGLGPLWMEICKKPGAHTTVRDSAWEMLLKDVKVSCLKFLFGYFSCLKVSDLEGIN